MKTMWKPFAALSIFLLICGAAFGEHVSACPKPFEVKQPDGTAFTVKAFGGGWSAGLETLDGYTVLPDPQTLCWVYADVSPGGELMATTLLVGRDRPAGLRPHLRRRPGSMEAAVEREGPVIGKPVLGQLPVLVILAEFQNRTLVGSNEALWKAHAFGAKSSVAHYFKEVSYSQFGIVPIPETYGVANDGIVRVKLKMQHPNTGDNTGDINYEVAKAAMTAADPYVNFAGLDLNADGAIDRREGMVVIVNAGYERSYGTSAANQPNIWAHSGSFSMAGVAPPTLDGVLLGDDTKDGAFSQIGEWHAWNKETGHMAQIGTMSVILGYAICHWPALWDMDGTSRGIGAWCLTSGGNWNGGRYDGDCPGHPSAFCKYFAGWVAPRAWDGVAKTFNFFQVETAKVNSIYRLGPNPNGPEYNGKGEYFLIENRQRVGYDKELPGDGLLIWHIDEKRGGNLNEGHTPTKHYLVDLEEADGRDDLANNEDSGDKGDPFPGSAKNRQFTNATKPHSKFYSGKDSLVRVKDISDSKSKMSASLSRKG